MKRIIQFAVILTLIAFQNINLNGQCEASIDLDENSMTAIMNCWGNGFIITDGYGGYNANFSSEYTNVFAVVDTTTNLIVQVNSWIFFEDVGEEWNFQNYCLIGVNYLVEEGIVIEVGQPVSDIQNDLGLGPDEGACIAISECVMSEYLEYSFVDIWQQEPAACIDENTISLSLEIYTGIFLDTEIHIFNSEYDTFFFYWGETWPLELTLPATTENYNVDAINAFTGCPAGNFFTIEVPVCNGDFVCEPFIELNEGTVCAQDICQNGSLNIELCGTYTANNSISYESQFILVDENNTIVSYSANAFFDGVWDGLNYQNYCILGLNYFGNEGVNIQIGQNVSEITNGLGLSIAEGACMAFSECIAATEIEVFEVISLEIEQINCLSSSTFQVNLNALGFPNYELQINGSTLDTFIQNLGSTSIELVLPTSPQEYVIYPIEAFTGCLGNPLTLSPSAEACYQTFCQSTSVLNANSVLAVQDCSSGNITFQEGYYEQGLFDIYMLIAPDGTIVSYTDVVYFEDVGDETNYDEYCVAAVDIIEGGIDFDFIIGQTLGTLQNEAGLTVDQGACMAVSDCISPNGFDNVHIKVVEEATCSGGFFTIGLNMVSYNSWPFTMTIQGPTIDSTFVYTGSPYVLELTLPILEGEEYIIDAFEIEGNCGSNPITIPSPNADCSEATIICDAFVYTTNVGPGIEIYANCPEEGLFTYSVSGGWPPSSNDDPSYTTAYLLVGTENEVLSYSFSNEFAFNYDSPDACIYLLNYKTSEGINLTVGLYLEDIVNNAGLGIEDGACIALSDCVPVASIVEGMEINFWNAYCIGEDSMAFTFDVYPYYPFEITLQAEDGSWDTTISTFWGGVDLFVPTIDVFYEAFTPQTGCTTFGVFDAIDCAVDPVCDFDNPIEDLPWINEQIPGFEVNVIEYLFEGNTVFLIEYCNDLEIGLRALHDCEGNVICFSNVIGGIDWEECPEFPTNGVLQAVWIEDCSDIVIDDCMGIPDGTAILDVCGNCLEPDDPNFNSCVFLINETICADSSFQYTIDLSGEGVQSPAFWFEPNQGVAVLDTADCWPCINGVDFIYTPNTGFIGTDTVGIAWFDETLTGEYFIYYYILEVIACEEVWPGDVNNNGLANNLDLIHLGLEYNNTGPTRPDASTDWIGQPMTNWQTEQMIGLNSKFADCDGNGTINLDDRDVILLNYDEEHDLGKTSAEGPPLYVELPMTIVEGEALEIPIFIGTESEGIENLYGVAFTIEFDSMYVEESSLSVDFNSSFLGTADVDVMGLFYTKYSAGKVEVGLSKIDNIEVNGSGMIGTMSLVMIDDIIGKEAASIPFELSITDITAISRDGSSVAISTTNAETEISTSIENIPISGFLVNRIYPNPANHVLSVEANQTIHQIQIANINGQLLLEINNLQVNKHDLRLDALPNGLYFLKVKTGDTEQIHEITILR